MSTRRPQRERGSLVDPQRVAYYIEAHVLDDFVDLAKRLDAPKSGLVQWMIENFPRTDDGIPLGWYDDDEHRDDTTLPGIDVRGAA